MPIRGQNPFFEPHAGMDLNRNPYVRKLLDAQAKGALPALFGTALKPLRGQWRHHFAERSGASPQPQRLCVEIGCHLGKTLVDFARHAPSAAFVGMDITFKRVFTAADRAHTAKLENIRAVLAMAQDSEALFADNEIDGFIVFFPDPWTRRSQAKNRLLTAPFAQLLFKKTAPGGFLWFKTDQEPYFNEACANFRAAGFEPTETIDLFGDLAFESTFERRFRLQGLPTYSSRWIKPGSVCYHKSNQ